VVVSVQDLHFAAEQCCSQLRLRMDPKAVTLPKVFKWYKEDLGSDKMELLRLAFDYCPESLQRNLLTLMNASQTKLKYLDFDHTPDVLACTAEIATQINRSS
jgi:hypothetical protein